jgi:endonuclease/exonuclease/phosphatase (EEP) superfamily protein YafD
MRVLTWNLFHGRARPGGRAERARPDRRGSLRGDFAQHLDGWEWDVALLQEVPPWWGPALGAATRAAARTARTSRNWLLPLRRAVAERRPELLGSWGGGANVILVRGQAIAEHRRSTLRLLPERRVVHAVRLADGTWAGNFHGQGNGWDGRHCEPWAQADLALAGRTLLAWAGDAALVLGGDTNTFRPVAPAGMRHAGGHRVDHVFARHLLPRGPAVPLRSDGLSDHAALVVELVREDSVAPGVHGADDPGQGGPPT